MTLASDASTAQELREEIVNLLLYRAGQHKIYARANSYSAQAARESFHAGKVLEDIAQEIETMKLPKSSPAALPVSHQECRTHGVWASDGKCPVCEKDKQTLAAGLDLLTLDTKSVSHSA